MDKYDNYMIRACKGPSTYWIIKNLKWVFRNRCMLDENYPTDELLSAIAGRLWTIIEENNLIKMTYIVDMFNKPDWHFHDEVISDNAKINFVLNRAIEVIRYSDCDKFPDYFYWGLRWRKQSGIRKSPYV